MENKKISVFDEPDKIDGIINTRLASFPRKGGHSNNTEWPEEEQELIDAVILQYVCEQGLSREKTAQQISARWDITLNTGRKWVKNAINRFCERFDDNDKEKLKKTFIERIETLLQSAIDDNAKDAALKALDLYGKTFGFFKDNKDVTLTSDNTIHFDFQQ